MQGYPGNYYQNTCTSLTKSMIYSPLPAEFIWRSQRNLMAISKLATNSLVGMTRFMIDAADMFARHNPFMVGILKVAEKNLEYLSHISKIHTSPELDVRYKTVREDDLSRLNLCKDSPCKNPNYLILMPIMRGPFLGFYSENGSDKIKSTGKLLLKKNAGRVFFIDWKQPEKTSLDVKISDYVSSMHQNSQFIQQNYQEPPININNCQPGYFDMIRLSQHPDDALVTVLVASPHKTLDPESITYNNLFNYSKDDLEALISGFGGKFPGDLLAESWEVANLDLFNKKVNDGWDTYLDIIGENHDFQRSDTFNSWMYNDIRDIPGPTMLEINDIFRHELMINEPLASMQKNYKNPLICVHGSKDNIVTRKMAVSVHDFVGTKPEWQADFEVSGGHAAVFCGSSAYNKKSSSFDDWTEDILPCIQRFAFEKRTIERL